MYKVIKNITNVQKGKAAPYYNQKGGGTQYKLPLSIEELVKNGFLKMRYG